MILYSVCKGVVSVMYVTKETSSGWRRNNGGFINRQEMGSRFIDLEKTFYTTSLEEAKTWSKYCVSHMYDVLQVIDASLHDIDLWQEDFDMEESSIPKSRLVETYQSSMEVAMKNYPLDIENVGSDTYILMSKGHHNIHEFMYQVRQQEYDWVLGVPEHIYIKATPDNVEGGVRYNVVPKGTRGSFPATYTWESTKVDSYESLCK